MRTDIHRPSSINPAEYEYVAQEYLKIEQLGDVFILQEERRKIAEHMARTGGTYSTHTHGGNCMVCGSVNAVYTVLFYHGTTNTYVRTGCDCAENIWKIDTSAFRKHIQDVLAARAGKRKAEKILEDAGLGDVIDIWNKHRVDFQSFPGQEEPVICGIADNVIKYGSLTENQARFLKVLLDRISNRAIREAKRKQEQENAADCPIGRIQIEGVVISLKIQDSQWGVSTKALVKHDSGYKVWGTVPYNDKEDAYVVGDRIRFTATVTRSDNDSKFGYYTRPAKATRIAVPAPVG